MDILLKTLALCCVALAAVNACSEGQFTCQTRWGSDCLAQRWVCDGDNDCVDNSDESQCGSARTCPDGSFSCSSGRCIPESWVCDGENDCRDSGTDEQNCGEMQEPTPSSGPQDCTEEQFSCQQRNGNNACINLLRVCDGENDCTDNRDENQCGSRRLCPNNWFACSSGRCIPSSWMCDGDNDCGDDESREACHRNPIVATNNGHGNCSEVQYACRSHRNPGGCIPLQFVCDGDNTDCVDRSDESNCGSSRTCPDRWHACASGRCIPENLVCDGGNDCPDGSDERQCDSRVTSPATPTANCSSTEFACRSRRRASGCIPRSWVCDGDHTDCYDDSDERNCAQQTCSPDQFACRSRRRASGCIPRSWVCDGDHTDCYDDSDEQNCGSNPTTSTPGPTTPGTDVPAATDPAAVPQTPAQSGTVKVELPSWLATDQDAHFALSLAPMLRARAPRDKLDAQVAVLRLFRDLAQN